MYAYNPINEGHKKRVEGQNLAISSQSSAENVLFLDSLICLIRHYENHLFIFAGNLGINHSQLGHARAKPMFLLNSGQTIAMKNKLPMC